MRHAPSCVLLGALVAASAAASAAASEPGPVVYAQPKISRGDPPASLTAPVPSTVRGFEAMDKKGPPRAQLTAALCRGDPSAQQRLITALRTAAARVPKKKDLDPQLAGHFVWLFDDCGEKPLCDWLARTLPGERESVRSVLWMAAAHCAGDDWIRLMDKVPPPSDVARDWYFISTVEHLSFIEPPHVPISRRLRAIALEVARGSDEEKARRIGVVLGEAEPEGALELVKTLQAKSPKLAPWFAVGQEDSPVPEARALYAAACQTEPTKHDPLCFEGQPHLPNWRSPPEELVRDPRFDPARFLRARPDARADTLEALERCVLDPQAEELERAGCLKALASIDRPRAVEAAKKVKGVFQELAAASQQLLRFPEAGALRRKLVSLKLLPDSAPAEKIDAALTAEEALSAAGLRLHFDVETDRYPNGHDELLLELAAMAGPALQGAQFEELAPALGDRRTPYQLHAWVGGKRYDLTVRNLGDWYDLPAVLGLLNTLLRDRGSELRYVTLPTGDQSASVLVGPLPALLQAEQEKLIAFEVPDQAQSLGSALDRSLTGESP